MNITHGCILSGDRLYDIQHKSNAFFSLLEPFGTEMRTAPAIQHMTLEDHVPVQQVQGAPGWLQIVHGGNVSNKVRGTRVDPAHLRAQFFDGTLAGVPSPGGVERLLDNTVLGPVRGLRDELTTVLRRVRGK